MPAATLHDTAPFLSIEPAGERCLLVRLGQAITPDVTRRVHALTARLLASPPAGVIDIVPSFTTLAVHYRPERIARGGLPAFRQLEAQVRALLDAPLTPPEHGARIVDVPVCYGGDFGPDLETVAERCGLSVDEVIARHAASALVVLVFYFSPGNPFAGPLDPRLALPRRTTPRTAVPAGSVAIANGLSTIYQVASPGGWHLIGRTPWNLFDLQATPPTRLALGDRLRFQPISRDTFALLDERATRMNRGNDEQNDRSE